MTTVSVVKHCGEVVRVECSGHAGYSVEGEDIVCAGLSSIVQTAVLGLLQVAKIPIKYTADDRKGTLKLTLPDNLSEKERFAASVILDTMLCGVADLQEGYSDFIELKIINGD